MSNVSTAPATSRAGTVPGASSPIMSHRQILLVIYGLMAGMFLASLDQTVVGTAIRTIGDDLHGLNQQAWVTTGYLIASTIATPIYGKLSDIFGRRPLYIFGIGVFLVGSLMSSFSTSMIMLAAFRAFQGIGAGALMSLPLAIMGDILAPRERARYQGFFLATFGISSVIGPLIGGLFAGTPQILFISGWRWVFLVNVPVGLIALGMVLAFLHLPKFESHRKPRIDWFGASAVIVALIPILLVSEQGRTWGWTSVGSIICYVVGVLGIATFIFIERRMGDDAIIPLKLFSSRVFSMASVLGFLIGFAMFGALLTIPLYLQIVIGLTPTQSGFATLPMVGGLMIAAIASGQIISRTGKYRMFPVIGTALTACGYLWLTFLSIDKPLWYLMIGMFLIGLGLGQLMQTITLASQNSVKPQDMGVATSSATFFRQIGGTLGTAVLLSVLFALIPGQISLAMQNKSDLSSGLNAALTPSVATSKDNLAIMKQVWDPIVTPIKSNVQKGLDSATAKVTSGVTTAVTERVSAAVAAEVAAGRVPAAEQSAIVQQQVAAALPQATSAALANAASSAHASVVDGKLAIDYSNASQRQNVVDKSVPKIITKLKSATSKASLSDSDTNNTAFLNNADPRLSRGFLTGFNASTIRIYWIGVFVVLLAFVLTWFFRTPPLRQTSALQQRADEAQAQREQDEADEADAADRLNASAAPAHGRHSAAEDMELEAVNAANRAGAPISPSTASGPIDTVDRT